MREIDIVAQIRKLAGPMPKGKGLVKGIGDDCTILRSRTKEDLVFTTDFVLEGRHFTLDTHSAAHIGHKALARSLSDLAAMGSEPVFCLVSLAVPSLLGIEWVRGFYRGLLALAKRYNTALAGGDLARFDSVVADVMCCGRVRQGRGLLRSTAQKGDRIFVTGELGGSAHGFAVKRGKQWRRHLRPEPRVEAGRVLARLRVSACMDLSDGLVLDLYRLCSESKVSAELTGALPIARGASLDEALYGGEDYELLFTAPAQPRIPSEIVGLPVTCIGVITSGNPGKIRYNGRPLSIKGFDHFA
ncbi:MAG: thiamine-phosphate kinase [Acidobacteriaceae bacterium]|nr:thiamine-phosphate kinase [Acidobacteriaceae bacterium]